MIRSFIFGFALLLFCSCQSGQLEGSPVNGEASPATIPATPTPTPPAAVDLPASTQVLPYCEIANNPYKYNGSTVRFKGGLYWFRHGLFVYDAGCSSEFPKQPSQPNDRYYDRRTGVSFDPVKREELWKKLEEHGLPFEKENSRWNIIATGKFSVRPPCQDGPCSDHILDRVFLELSISDLESVKIVIGESR